MATPASVLKDIVSVLPLKTEAQVNSLLADIDEAFPDPFNEDDTADDADIPE